MTVHRLLLVVDMVKDFATGGKLPVPDMAKIIPSVVGKVNEYRKEGFPVMFLCDRHEKDDSEFKLFPPHCIRGTEGAEILDELEFGKSLNDSYNAKATYSGFPNTTLKSVIKMKNPSIVEVCGVLTSVCVMENVGGLYFCGYKTEVDRSAVADLTPADHENALRRMNILFGTKVF